jgi:NTE family protein
LGSTAVAASSLLGACSMADDSSYDAADAPAFDSTQVRPAKVAWVLGSGGPRGFVHIGVLKALSELGHKPDLIVGSSVGALVGCLYACGKPIRELEKLALEMSPTEFGRVLIGGEGRLSGNPIAERINLEVMNKQLQQLPTRFVAVALERQRRVTAGFNVGNCGYAVQASCAIEGMYSPLKFREVQWVDADKVAPLPVRVARSHGAIKILAVDASAHEQNAPPGAERFKESDAEKRRNTQADSKLADLVLHPDFGYWVSVSREFRERAIRIGYEHTMSRRAAIAALYA